jgi:hypothetical protein
MLVGETWSVIVGFNEVINIKNEENIDVEETYLFENVKLDI